MSWSELKRGDFVSPNCGEWEGLIGCVSDVVCDSITVRFAGRGKGKRFHSEDLDLVRAKGQDERINGGVLHQDNSDKGVEIVAKWRYSFYIDARNKLACHSAYLIIPGVGIILAEIYRVETVNGEAYYKVKNREYSAHRRRFSDIKEACDAVNCEIGVVKELVAVEKGGGE